MDAGEKRAVSVHSTTGNTDRWITHVCVYTCVVYSITGNTDDKVCVIVPLVSPGLSQAWRCRFVTFVTVLP